MKFIIKNSKYKKASKKKQAQPDFETSLQHLKEALAALESEELTLEQSLAQYEAGIKYLGHCHGALEVARQKIEQLVSIDENGQVVTCLLYTSPSPRDRG